MDARVILRGVRNKDYITVSEGDVEEYIEDLEAFCKIHELGYKLREGQYAFSLKRDGHRSAYRGRVA